MIIAVCAQFDPTLVYARNLMTVYVVWYYQLHHAAWAGNLDVFRTIVEAGGDVERRRNTAWRPNGGVRGRGNTPLHAAVMYRRVPIIKYLLHELGCDVNSSGEQGYTPLHIRYG